jgi:hypothetical protein
MALIVWLRPFCNSTMTIQDSYNGGKEHKALELRPSMFRVAPTAALAMYPSVPVIKTVPFH